MTKFVVAEVDPFTVGILRTVVAGLICLVVALVIGLSLPKTASAWLLMGFSVSRCYIGFPVLFTLGEAETTTSHVALIIAIMPVLMGLFAALTELRMREDGGSDRRRLSSGLPFWSALGSALVAATTRWMATYCVLPLRSAALPDILQGVG